MAKDYQFSWRSQIPELLFNGDIFDKYDDETNTLDLNCFVCFEEYGFFMYWEPKNKDAGILDISQIWEARPSGTIKDFRILFELEQRGFKESVESRTIWITYGQDLVNVNNLFLIAKTAQIAKDWRTAINKFLRTYKFRHACPMHCLKKHWRSLCLAKNERGRIPLRNIVKTFASGKPERMVYKCLTDLGLSGDKFFVTKRVVISNKTWTNKITYFYKLRTNHKKKKKEREDLDVNLFTFEKFLRLYHKICPRTDIQELFVKLSGQKEYLTKERLTNFLNEEQRDPRLNEILFPFFDSERVKQLIAKYETDESYISHGKMSGDGFFRFLMSDENAAVFLDRTELYQDMDQPLCHYYINSSHNTYLTGRQYGGKSSTEIYRQVLLSGCRCIELDCWDGTGENKGEPIITHGKAMCTDVFFRDVLLQIRETAFAKTDFPVILSFENHCSKSIQLKMAKYCMEIFGDMLLSKSLDDYPLEPGVPLPSPNRLKNKILIKNKRLKSDVEKIQLEQFLREGKLDEDEEITETPDVVPNNVSLPPKLQNSEQNVANVTQINNEIQPSKNLNQRNASSNETKTLQFCSDQSRALDNVKEDEFQPEQKQLNLKLKPLNFTKKLQVILTKEEEERIFAEYNYTGATTNIHPLLSNLINYTHPVKFSGFDVAESNDLHFHMSSFSESTGLGYLKQSAPEFVNYNKRQLSRIYPKGARVDSSNFLPQIFWNAGCQMVSLNFQTPDVCMQLNQGKFDYNGQCGYLLKPDFMRRPDRTFDPFSESPVDGVIAAHCSVKVISGHFLCDRKVGTYVEVEMYGLPTDTIRKEHRTRTVPGNGLNPIYNDDPFVFRKVVLPELAVLRFAVYDENGKQLGQRILPLDGLQSGYRHISLRTESNMPLTLSTLFVHLVLKTYVPDELSGLVDALADPRAYVSAQEKRQEALHLMGVDDSDIVEVTPTTSGNLISNTTVSTKQFSQKRIGNINGLDLISKNQKQNGSIQINETRSNQFINLNTLTNEMSSLGYLQKQSNENLLSLNSDNKLKVESINLNDLRKNKIFQKQLKKQQKDVEEMKKKHQKQREFIQKQQQLHVDKLLINNNKSLNKKQITINLNNLSSSKNCHISLNSKTSDPVSTDCSNNSEKSANLNIESINKKKICNLISNQTDEWSKLVRTQELEDFELRKKQITEEFNLLRKLVLHAQKRQMINLRAKFESKNKELKQLQTKKSMEGTRAIQQDKGIKTKAERDRRVKELNEKNVKMFVEERRRLATKCRRHEEQLEKRHTEQNETLEKEISKLLEQEEMNHQESLLASRPEFIV